MLRRIISELFRAARHTEEDGGELLVDTLRRIINKQIVGFSNGILLRRQGDGISEVCPCSDLPIRIRGVLQYQQKAFDTIPLSEHFTPLRKTSYLVLFSRIANVLIPGWWKRGLGTMRATPVGLLP
jgi:hypothetical protein